LRKSVCAGNRSVLAIANETSSGGSDLPERVCKALPAAFGCQGISRCRCTLAGREEMGAG